MLLKDSVHPLYRADRCSPVAAGAFQKQHFKTNCTVLSVMSFKTYQFFPNTLLLDMEGLTFMSSIRNGVLRYFNAEARLRLWSMRADLQPVANIESGTSSKTISFSTFVPSLPFETSRLKVTFSLSLQTASSWLLILQSDVEIQSHILQVAVDSNEYTAEVYTYDKRLQATLSLGEGRQRFHADKYDLPSGDSDALKTVQNRLMQMERQAEQEKEDLRRQMEQEKDDLRRQMEQVLDDMKRQTRS